jgi:hypothetical protein
VGRKEEEGQETESEVVGARNLGTCCAKDAKFQLNKKNDFGDLYSTVTIVHNNVLCLKIAVGKS